MKLIMLPTGGVTKLAKDMGVSRITVWKALRFKTKSERADKIRQAALKRGGKIYEPPKATIL